MMPHARSYKEYTEGALPRIYLAGHLPLFSPPPTREAVHLSLHPPPSRRCLQDHPTDGACPALWERGCCSLARPAGLNQDQHDQEQEQSTELQPGIKVVSNEAR